MRTSRFEERNTGRKAVRITVILLLLAALVAGAVYAAREFGRDADPLRNALIVDPNRPTELTEDEPSEGPMDDAETPTEAEPPTFSPLQQRMVDLLKEQDLLTDRQADLLLLAERGRRTVMTTENAAKVLTLMHETGVTEDLTEDGTIGTEDLATAVMGLGMDDLLAEAMLDAATGRLPEPDITALPSFAEFETAIEAFESEAAVDAAIALGDGITDDPTFGTRLRSWFDYLTDLVTADIDDN